MHPREAMRLSHQATPQPAERAFTRPTVATAWALLLGSALLVSAATAQQADPQRQGQPPAQADQPGGPKVDVSKSPVPVEPVAPPKPAKKSKKDSPPAETPTGDVTGAPAIRIDEPAYDFGQRWQGADLRHEFVIRNGGDQELQILSARASCGCTVVQDYAKSISPGGTGGVPVVLSTMKVSNDFTKYITVTCNDPVTPAVRLSISGTVKPFVTVDPSTVAIGHIAEDATVTKSVTLVNNTDERCSMTLKSKKDGPFTAELVEKVPGKEFELVVRADPPYQPKLNRSEFVLETTLRQQAQVAVPVTAYVPPRLDLRPEQLIVPRRGSTEQQQVIQFTNNGEKPVKVLSAEADDQALQLEVIERTAGKVYDVKVTIPPDYEPSTKPKTITLATDDPQTPKLTVPVKGKPQPEERPAAKLVGTMAPAAEFTTTGGQTIRTGEATGKVTVLDFFASWCGYSKRQVPMVAQVHGLKFADNPDVLFVGIDQDDLEHAAGKRPPPTPQQIAAMWTNTGATFEYALDPAGVGRSKFLVSSYPTLMILGKDGKIEAVHFGARLDLDAVIDKQVNDLLAGKSLVVGASDQKVDTGQKVDGGGEPRTTTAVRPSERRPGVETAPPQRSERTSRPQSGNATSPPSPSAEQDERPTSPAPSNEEDSEVQTQNE